jgi:nucleoside-diphosphate-sugar epimerase
MQSMDATTKRDRHHVLVLGGTGFLGVPLVRQLASRADVRLTLLAHQRAVPDLGGIRAPDDLRVVSGDLGSMKWDWCHDDPPQWVFHCARLAGSGVLGRWRAAWRGRNANRRLLEMLSRLPHPPRLVYASGSLMYGCHGDEWVDETTPLAPTSFARQYVLAERPFLRAHGALQAMMVRPGWVLGDGSWLRTFYLEPATRAGGMPIYGDGRNWMTCIHREECAAMMRRVMTDGIPGKVYNLAPHAPITQTEMAEAFARELGVPVRTQSLAVLQPGWDRAVKEAFASSIRLRTGEQSLWGDVGVEVGVGVGAGPGLGDSNVFKAIRDAAEEYKARIRREARAACD